MEASLEHSSSAETGLGYVPPKLKIRILVVGPGSWSNELCRKAREQVEQNPDVRLTLMVMDDMMGPDDIAYEIPNSNIVFLCGVNGPKLRRALEAARRHEVQVVVNEHGVSPVDIPAMVAARL